MRQPIYEDPDWTLEIDPTCSREETWDGFTVFEKPGLSTFAAVYCGQSFDAECVVRNMVSSNGLLENAEVSFEALEGGLAGAVSIVRGPAGVRLTGAASSYGHVARLSFVFQDEAFLPEALAVWRSLRHVPPEYARLCGEADPPLADLRAKLEGEPCLQDAIAEIRRRGQIPEAMAVLLAALADDYHLAQRNACEALALLGDRSPAVVDALRACMADPSGEIGAWAGGALLELGESPEVVARAMTELLTRPEPSPNPEEPARKRAGRLWGPERYHAARVLTCVGEAARPYYEIVQRFQRDEHAPLRLRVAEILLNLGDSMDTVTPPIYEAADNALLELLERSRVAEWLLEYADPPTETADRLRAIRAEYQEQCDREYDGYGEPDAKPEDASPGERSSDSDQSPTG
jgi:hypothetical protein